MSFNIASIKWPENGRDANILLRKLFIKVLESVGMEFSSLGHNPQKIVENYINLSKTSFECIEYEKHYKHLLENEGFTRDFRNQKAIDLRIAAIMVHINEENLDNLGEQLSWFI